MPDTGEIKLNGFKELAQALRELPEKVRIKVLKGAQRKAAQVIATDAGNRLAPAGSEKDMIVSVRLHSDGVKAFVGPRRGPRWYLWFREFGTSLHKVKASQKKILAEVYEIAPGGMTFGKMKGLSTYHQAQIPTSREAVFFGKEVEVQQPAKPFLRPAFDAKKEEAIEQLGKELGPAIEKAMREALGRFSK